MEMLIMEKVVTVATFINTTEYPAYVCNAKGDSWRIEKAPKSVRTQVVLGTAIFTDYEITRLFVWVD
jgi:hypothetical protein